MVYLGYHFSTGGKHAESIQGTALLSVKRRYVATIRGETVILLHDVQKTRDNDKEAHTKYDNWRQTKAGELDGDRAEVWAICNRLPGRCPNRTIPPPLAPTTYEMHKDCIQDFCSFRV